MPLIMITTICMRFAWTIGCTAAMLIRHVNDGVMEVFHITGFADILVIE